MQNEKYKMKNDKCAMRSIISHFAFCILHFAFCIPHSLFFRAIALATILGLPIEVFAQQPQPPEILGIRVGLADRYKVGLWTQVEVALQGGGEALAGQVSVVVPDGDGVPSRVSTPPEQPCRLQPGQPTTVRLLCRLGRVHGTLTVEFRTGGQLVAQRTFKTAKQADAEHFLPGLEFQRLIVTVGPSTMGVEQAGKLGGVEPERRPVTAHLEDLGQLPVDWLAYEGVDALILSTSRPEIYRQLAADDPRMQALDEWIRMGGRLVLCVGAQAEEILADDAPLRQFAPGRFVKMVPLRQTGALEAYCGSRSAVPRAGNTRTLLRVPRLDDVQGTIEAQEADLPLTVRTVRGFGQVLFLAADLDEPPLDAWPDRSMLVARLLDMPTGGVEESEERTAMMHFGYGDMSGQLRSALDRFDGVRIAPFWLVAGLIVVYLLLIGPGDYFFLRKLVGRMTWTWLTFPLVVLLACLGAYVLAYRLKGDQLKVHQVDLVDVDAVSGRLRGTTWLNVFSPRMEPFNLSVEPYSPDGGPLGDARVWMAWFGLPGGAIGGMNPRAGDPALSTESYSFSPMLDAMRGVPIQVWSTKSFTARWKASTAELPEADLTDEDELLTGTLTNTLGFPLERCILAHGGSVYELDTLGPGESAQLGMMSKRSELKTLLTGRKFVFVEKGDQYRHEATPYDQASTNIPYILRTMMFYEAAGGRRYTGLWNAYQDFVDFSPLLAADRAILVAQSPRDSQEASREAALLRDGKPLGNASDKHVIMYRFLFPVKKGEGKD